MNVIYENIARLCAEKSKAERKVISLGKMCARAGVNKWSVTHLQNHPEETLSPEDAQKIAAYFEVPVERVLGTEKAEKATVAAVTEPAANPAAARSRVKEEFIQKVLQMDDEMVSTLNTLADQILAREKK